MRGAVTFQASATSLTTDVIVVGDFSVVPGAADTHVVRYQGQTFNLTDDGLADFRGKINSIAAGRHESIKG